MLTYETTGVPKFRYEGGMGSEPEIHLNAGPIVPTLLVEADVLLVAVEDNLVAASLLSDMAQSLNQFLTQGQTLLALCHGDVLNVADAAALVDQLRLHNARSTGYNVVVRVGDDEREVRARLAGPELELAHKLLLRDLANRGQHLVNVEHTVLVVARFHEPDLVPSGQLRTRANNTVVKHVSKQEM